jgi:competence protein ComEC
LIISFLDVGQGDAIVVQFPQGTTMLIDSGGRPAFPNLAADIESDGADFVEDTLTIGETVVSQFLWHYGIQRIDYIMPTHADTDHIQGFADILKNFDVGRAIVARTPTDDPEFRMFERALRKTNVPVQPIGTGDQFTLEEVSVEVLWPPHLPEHPPEWMNDESLVLRMRYGGHAILLTGDIGQAVEEKLIASGADLRSDILKVPHHGSRTSSSIEFIGRMRPRYAVISVGQRSPFGHPHPEVVDRYHTVGINVLQTSKNGTITVSTDGTRLEIRTYTGNEMADEEGSFK